MTDQSGATRLRVLLANRSRLDREGLAALIRETDRTIEVTGIETAQQAFENLRSTATSDVLVISVTPCSQEDLGRIGDRLRAPAPNSGASNFGAANSGAPNSAAPIPVVLIMTSVAPATASNLIGLGIKGIVLSSASAQVLVAAIRMAAGGNTYLPPELVFGRVQAESGAGTLDSLTPREVQIMALLGEGQSNKEIARRLKAKEATVKVQIHRLMRKLGVANRTQAAVLASRHDLIQAQALEGES